MYKAFLIILYLIFTLASSFAQVKFPYPINTESHENSPALLQDSSVMIMSDREGLSKCYRFVFNGNDWESSPNSLTEQINALMYADGAHGNFSFSSDYSRLIFTLHQRERKNYFESQLVNGKWGLFKEIVKGKDRDKDEQRDHTPLMYSGDLSKLYVLNDRKPYNVIYYYTKTTKGWSDRQEITYFMRDFDVIWGSVVPIGNDGLLLATPPDINKNAKKTNSDQFFYTKQISADEWTAPRYIKDLNINAHVLELSLTASKNHFTYSLFLEGDVYMIEVPEFLKEEIAKTRTAVNEETKPQVVSQEPKTESIGSPTYHALLIGISDYDNNNQDLRDLDNPVNDAQKLKNVLVANYTFDPGNVRVLENPNRAEFINELENLSKKVQEKDNLLIFYAGHGFFDKNLNVGYWLPADATTTSKANWISNSTIRDYLAGVNSKHTLLISDACFSGSIFKTREVTNTLDNFGFARMYKLKSRKAITSGTLNTVPDESVFLQYLIKRLSENENQYLPAGWLFHDIEAAVINNTSNIPQYGTIQNSGDEGGDFIFIRK